MAVADHALAQIRFIHVHIMLAGFMAMIIYGVGYHILPRFNANPMPYPALVPVHFWLANVALWGMCVMYALGGFYTTGPLRMLFGLFGAMEGVAIFIFIVNILGILREEPAKQTVRPISTDQPTDEPTGKTIKLAPSMTIAEILERYPTLEEPLTALGFGALADPAVRATVATMVTLEMAARKAGKEPFSVIAALEGKQLVTSHDSVEAPPVEAGNGSGINRGQLPDLKTKIGPLLETYPETRVVFEKHYGAACFTCPGQQTETIEETARMHNMAPEIILDEINSIINTVLE